jgi:hypothetical protein
MTGPPCHRRGINADTWYSRLKVEYKADGPVLLKKIIAISKKRNTDGLFHDEIDKTGRFI